MEFLNLYFEDLFSKLFLVYPDLKDDPEMQEIIRKNVLKKKETFPVKVENNYTNTLKITNSENILDIMYTKKPTLSGYGVLFHNREKKDNIPGIAIDYLLDERKVAKKKMLSHINDFDKIFYDNFNTIQTVLKVLCNSFFGAYGEKSFHFFNTFLGPSVTYTGRHIIASAILGFENLLADNIKFESFNEIITFIFNVQKEPSNVEYDLHFNFTVEETLERFVSKCDFNVSDAEKEILNDIFSNLSQFDLDRIYMKNNLARLLEETDILDLICDCITPDYLNPEKIPESILDNLNLLNGIIDYYISYIYQYPNKVDRAARITRKVILVTDTDSTFIYLDLLVQKIKRHLGNKVISSEENISIVNIFTHSITKFIERVFYEIATNYNIIAKDRKRISMKNEFLFERVILTENKKQYAAKLLMKEGEIYKKPKFEIKGLQIKKVGTPKVAREIFKKILEDDILDSKNIQPMKIFKTFISMEKQIENSLKTYSTNFLKPSKFNSLKGYVSPLTQQVVRGVLLWNTLYPSNAIQNMSKVWILKFKDVELEDLHKFLPSDVMDNINQKYFTLDIKGEKESTKTIKDYKLEVLAIPKELDFFPKEFYNLIDEITIVNDIIKNGNILLESIGFTIISSFTHKTASNTLVSF